MALNFSTLTKPVNDQVVDPSTGVIRDEWKFYFQAITDQLNASVGVLSEDIGAVTSVFGRVGDVDAEDDDYAADQVTFTPAGGLVATDTQGAIEELDAEKVPNARQVATGTGLTGGGNLSADRTLSLSHLGIQNLTDPGADRVYFWDDSAGITDWLVLGTGLSISDKTINAAASSSLPRGHIFGLRLANNATDANNDIDIAAGTCRSDDNDADMVLAGTLVKRLDASWAVGTNQGGLDTSSEASNTWYYVWLIKRSDTGVVDALFSTSATSPTMPTSYDKKRRIGAVRNNASSNLIAFTQDANDPDLFLWNTTILDVAVNSLGASRNLFTLTVPPSMYAYFRATLETSDSVAATVVIQPALETDAAPSLIAVPGASLFHAIDSSTGTAFGTAGHFDMPVNASSQIAARATSANTDFNVMTRGWRDLRGRLN